MNADEIERALRAILPSVSPAQLMDAVVQRAVAVSRVDPQRKRLRATRRHGAYVRKRELEQSQLYNLPLDVIDLQRQLAQLRELRDMLQAQTLNARDAGDGSLVRTASVYYDVMARDFQEVVVTTSAQRIDTRAYLAAAMSEDVRIGRFCGRRHFAPMMQRYSTFFADNRLALTQVFVQLSTHDLVVVRTIGKYSARLTPRTIRELFPHITTGEHDHLVARLLAGTLEGENVYDFVFDRASGRVARFDAEMNFLAAFMRLVPDPEQLAFLLGQAKISEEMFIGDLDEFDDARAAACNTTDDEGSRTTVVDSSDSEVCPTPSPPSRALKMQDLLSPEDDDRQSSVRIPSLYV